MTWKYKYKYIFHVRRGICIEFFDI